MVNNDFSTLGTQLTITTTYEKSIPVVHVAGEVDCMTRPEFAEVVQEEFDECPRGLVLDLLGVRFFGSDGLRVLLEAKQRAAQLHAGLCLVADQEAVVKPLRITGLAEFFDVRPTVPDAVRALSAA
jgi:anti-sigma B factor antagonist